MTAAPARKKKPAAHRYPRDTDFVLPAALTLGHRSRGPRLGENTWDLRDFIPRTSRQRFVNLAGATSDLDRRTMKEYLYARLRVPVGRLAKPIKVTWLAEDGRNFLRTMQTLSAIGVPRLQDLRKEHLDSFLTHVRPFGPGTVESQIATLKTIAVLGDHLSADRLTMVPWPYRSARQISGLQPGTENTTARIPEEIMRPFLTGVVFYVETAAQDVITARRELARIDATEVPRSSPGGARQKFEQFIAERRAQGRGIPALPLERLARRPAASVIDGVVQAPNLAMAELLTQVRCAYHLLPLLEEAGSELGYEEGGLPFSRADWPSTGRPWRPEFSRSTLEAETSYVRTACWAAIAYLSGMRDAEVRDLRRDCARVETAADGRPRYKIHGRVYKDRKVTGEEADWVVLDLVHRAVKVLLAVNDDPTHLFGYTASHGSLGLIRQIPQRLNDFRDHLNELFSDDAGLFVPAPAVTGTDNPDPQDDARAVSDTGTVPAEPMAWRFDTLQFRRTLAWHIANQPFGMVAGTRQYKHASFAIFEGYAGTSASGFADEVEADKATAKLDYVEDLYHDWNEGGQSAGGATPRIEAEFDRIRAELGDLPGTAASPERLRTMLRHLTRTLHPGVLNDCFHQPATAVCEKRSKGLGRPLPMLNMCLTCPNSRRSSVHLPRLHQTRASAVNELGDAKDLPAHQQSALGHFIATLDSLIDELRQTKRPETP
ncbi:hypothetical protein EDD93_5859 [Streptomyces sp. 840.1]|uniref:hypothetical protein n=1 Tax=Streptomyces sp. 840.1 TaxID=2485152 RepID=UPI000F4AB98A|nr:hypothetical protein [Streptomyces sp. 840.1]ROQ63121.1 hypothetical protein EDD93_5859 [Streptomyces sp. 840.1]